MAAEPGSARHIYGFARNTAIEAQSQVLNSDVPHRRDSALRNILQELSRRVQTEKRALENLHKTHENVFAHPNTDPVSQLWQLNSVKAAYDRLSAEWPQLPQQDSPLPELLALRSASYIAVETRVIIPSALADVESIRRQSASENARLHAYHLLASALRERVETLRMMSGERAALMPTEILQTQIEDQGAQQEIYVDEGDLILEKLTAFINEHLASMLAAEDHGGPPVGDLVNITDEVLGAGFTAKGKTRQLKSSDIEGAEALAKMGQQRRAEASKEIRKLIRRLLRLFDSDKEAYITLGGETAASRYLIQANIAELHPDDALQMRLLNFTGDSLT